MRKPEQEISAFYDATAKSWADNWYENEKMVPLLQHIISALPPTPRILDVGCGAGYESMRLHNLGAQAVGIDISEKSIAIAKEKNPGSEFHVMNLFAIDSGLGLFDGAVAIASLIHIPENTLLLAFESIARVLHPGGRLFIVFSKGNGKNYGYAEEKSVTEIDGIQHNRHFHYHSPETMISAAKIAGLQYVEDCPEVNDGNWIGHHYQCRL